MALLDDTTLTDTARFTIVNRAGRREITHAVHDIDGTYSLIRDWPPVMSLSIHWAMTCGLEEDFDSEANLRLLIGRVGREPLPETDRFCVESAGLSALTQMEFGIRRAIELGRVPAIPGLELTNTVRANNALIIRRIWEGGERFDDISEPAALGDFIRGRTPRLFRFYEKILNGACRDRNTAEAWRHPEKFLVPGGLAFMARLHELGVRNYFVTGAVISDFLIPIRNRPCFSEKGLALFSTHR
ncbi:MAG: hypothetical protein ABIF71_14580 [Planctomycetota bacterium]